MLIIQNHDFLPDYTTYPREFKPYHWYSPILIWLATGMMTFLFTCLLLLILAVSGELSNSDFMYRLVQSLEGGYDTLDVYTWYGAVAVLGTNALMIPALWVATIMVKDRPFSSYTSSRNAWNWKIFGQCTGIALLVCAVPNILTTLLQEEQGDVLFTTSGLILCSILGPMQCIAEEYIFRGFLMQTFGAWTYMPLIAIIVQAFIFGSLHAYDFLGVCAVVVSGIVFGISAHIAKGIEASSALHIVNNMTAFYLTGFGLGQTTSTTTWSSFLYTVFIDIAYLAVIIGANKKWKWFSRQEEDNIRKYQSMHFKKSM